MAFRKLNTLQQEQSIIATFNHECPIGSEVDVTRDDGTVTRTKTRSAAFLMGGHTAMVQLEGEAGCYMVSRVHPIQPK